jgi:elongation factor 2
LATATKILAPVLCNDDTENNALVNAVETPPITEITESLKSAWQWVTTCGGVLCEEKVRDFRIDLEAVVLHADAIHRGGGQIIPTARRAMLACQLMAGAVLLEPVFSVTIGVLSPDDVRAVEVITAKHSGTVVKEERSRGEITVHIASDNIFGLSNDLGPLPILRCILDQWRAVEGDPLVLGTPAHEAVRKIRVLKGLKPEVPRLEDLT